MVKSKKNLKILLLPAGLLFLYTAATGGSPVQRMIPVVYAEQMVDPKQAASEHDRQTRIEEYKTRREHIDREIEKSRQEVEAISRDETDILKRLNQVEMAFNKSRKRAALLSKEIETLDHEISAAAQKSEELRRRIRANEAYVAKRLVAMYKMNWLGTIDLLASADSMQEFIQRKAALRYILAYDEKIRTEMVTNQAELEKVLADLEVHKIQKNKQAEAYEKQIKQMSEERSMRQKLLADIRDQKALELAAIRALSKAAEELDGKINALREEMSSENRAGIASHSTFSAHKGLLIMPVNGTIVSSFGPYKNRNYNITNFRSGIDIKAEKGEPIRSVFKGKILYSDWFKGYGNMIIIDHSNNYYTVYAHLEEIFKSKGDEVEAGEVIATVGDTGSLEGAGLYFEVRHHGKPVDPLLWLKKG